MTLCSIEDGNSKTNYRCFVPNTLSIKIESTKTETITFKALLINWRIDYIGELGYWLKEYSVCSDPWNVLDFTSLIVYLIILTLRVTTWITSGRVMDNRVLAIAGYLYSFNTLCLTLRVFGYITEQSRYLGVTQIALFGIIKDMSTIILQFIGGILAFSIAITKVYISEQSFIANGDVQKDK